MLEAVLLDVVARAEHERGVDLGLRARASSATSPPGAVLGARSAARACPRGGPPAASRCTGGRSRVSRSRAVSARLHVDGRERQRLGELRRAGEHAALVVDDHRVAVEDQLVLAADEVAERDRGQVVARALGEHPLALAGPCRAW